MELTVELKDLHERNTANFFSLTYLSGVEIEVGLLRHRDTALELVADALERLDKRRQERYGI